MNEFHDVSLEVLAEATSLSQAERLAYIDLKIRYLGEIARADIMSEFKIASAAASKDLNLYRELKPHNSEIDTKSKRTILKEESYTPLVKISAHTALNLIQHGFCRGELMTKNPMLSVETIDPAYQPNRLKEEQVSTVTKAINKNCGIKCTYGSKSGDHHCRTLFPTALFMDRKNWYFRAYDRNDENPDKSAFKNFKLSRIFNVSLAANLAPKIHERMSSDIDWNTELTFIVKFKDGLPQQDIDEISREFCISDRVHSITCKAALALYVKENWKIDLTGSNNNYSLYYFDLLNADSVKKVKSISSLF
ncbi:WYL domain-containing protein [Aeromonas veronii]|uniref:WYL domain-containing protein n=1 Tax=Aeromonas veronii TaxID=654 RepID=UPI0035B7A10F